MFNGTDRGYVTPTRMECILGDSGENGTQQTDFTEDHTTGS